MKKYRFFILPIAYIYFIFYIGVEILGTSITWWTVPTLFVLISGAFIVFGECIKRFVEEDE